MRSVGKKEVRPAAAAGLFYPRAVQALESEIHSLLVNAQPARLHGELKALICPHAGYRYSGSTAATSYRLLSRGGAPLVVIISPSHFEYFEGVSVFTGRGYQTPLGLVPVAAEICSALVDCDPLIFSSWAGHGKEHGLEVQLPFLQITVGDFEVVPVVMGDQREKTGRRLAEALARTLADVPSLLIASSDLSHYHPYYEATQIDDCTCGYIDAFDEAGLIAGLADETCEACGGGPIFATLAACKLLGADTADVLEYKNSGDITGEHSRVVGYVSAAIYQHRSPRENAD